MENFSNFKKHALIPGYGIRKMKNPSMFQGNRKRKKYFEGWYFKMVSADGSSILSVIPGISLSKDGSEQHAFIQIIDGKTTSTFYYDFPIEDFEFSREKFAVRIGKNYFSEDKLTLDIEKNNTTIKANITMSGQVNLSPNKNARVGIMGWYRFVPFMECYHGVVSLNHTLRGTITINNQHHNFDNGQGYIEKDWGKSMPSAWIWMQSNNFTSSNKASFMLSVATIPWLGSSFTGFIGFFLNGTTVHRFATYTHARLLLDKSTSDTIKIVITDKKYTYTIETSHINSGLLKAPVKGSMDRRIAESIDAQLELTVKDRNDVVIFQDTASIAGLEIVGSILPIA